MYCRQVRSRNWKQGLCGTHVPHSPCFQFLDRTWRQYIELLGIHVELRMDRSGFYPRGGGVIHAELTPAGSVRGFHLEQPAPVTSALVLSAVASLPEHIAKRQARR